MGFLVRVLLSIQSAVNAVTPFARPATPLWLDLTHATVLFAVLFYAPTIFSSDRDGSSPLGLISRRWRQARLGGTDTEQSGVDVSDGPQALVEGAAGGDPSAYEFDDFDDFDDDDDDTASDNDEDGEDGEGPGHDGLPAVPLHETGANVNMNQNMNFNDDNDGDLPGMNGTNGVNGANHAHYNTRAVGTKKARSLARRERQRAYHEYLRHMSDLQRAREESVREATTAEREESAKRREAARVAFDEKVKLSRLDKRQREERDRADVDAVVSYVRQRLSKKGKIDADGDAIETAVPAVSFGDIVDDLVPHRDEAWVEQTVRRSGIVGPTVVVDDKTGVSTVREIVYIVRSGWVVKIDRPTMDRFYRGLEAAAADRESLPVSELPAIFASACSG